MSGSPTKAAKVARHPSEAELLERATKLVPVLKERAARCEQLRQIPPETVADFIDAGFDRMCSPERFGGMGHSPELAMYVAVEIGRGCGSSAWMASQWPGHGFLASVFSEEAQAEYFGTSRNVLSSTASATVHCTVDEAPGGVRLTGTWKFSSGADWADWIFPHTPLGVFLVPKADFTVEDDWDVFGLEGTGSKTVHVKDAFVPAHRIVPFEAVFVTAKTPGAAMYKTPFHNVPYSVWGGHMLGAPVIGTALGFLETFDERIRNRMDPQNRRPSTERVGNQLRFAESSCDIEAATLVLRNTLKELHDLGAAGEVPMPARLKARRDICYAVKLCVQAVDRLFVSGDSRGIFSSMPTQRLFRDVHAAATHLALTWDAPAAEFSRDKWGLPPDSAVVNRIKAD